MIPCTSSGTSGHTWHSTGGHVGGFYGDQPDAELFVRWTAASVFGSHFRFHGIGERGLLHLHMLERGFSYGRRGFIALSLPLAEPEIDGFAGAVEEFLTAV